MTQLCANGSDVALDPPTYSHWGAGIGISVDQVMMQGTAFGVADETGTAGISYTLTNLTGITPSQMRITICAGPDNSACAASDTYCALLTSASGMIPWAQFYTGCTDSPQTGQLAGAPAELSFLQLEVPSETNAIPAWDFCVACLSIH